jgi:hypothetical protein
MRTLRISIIAAALAVALGGCGGLGPDDPDRTDVPGGGDSADVEVIEAWSEALRAGDVEEAASYFAIPSLAENGTPPIPLRSEAEVLAFNESLPCGAVLVSATSAGHFTTATFKLTDRPGGGCGPGAGGTARTSFAIEDGKIVEWIRVPDEPSLPEGRVV